MTITRKQITQLSNEAAEAGDEEQVAICHRALDGDTEAAAECERVIDQARADGHAEAGREYEAG